MVSLYYKIKRKLYKKLHLRPDSRPFISGDTFRSISDFIYEDELQKFKYHEVGFKQIVFVASHLLFKFLSEIHPLIKNQYILISHNGDNNIGEAKKHALLSSGGPSGGPVAGKQHVAAMGCYQGCLFIYSRKHKDYDFNKPGSFT